MSRGMNGERVYVRAHWLKAVAIGVILSLPLSTPRPTQARAEGQGEPAPPSPLSTVKGREYTLEKWADGVYLATGGTGSQNCVVVNDQDVLLFDVGTTPAGARALLEDLKLITDRPVRTVVNSHFHYDHVFGNGAFGPDVQIIGHRYTRTAILTFDTLHREPFLSWRNRTSAAQVDSLSRQIADAKIAQDRSALEAQLSRTRRDLERAGEIAAVPPNLTFESTMVLNKGGREIQLLFLGRGHTAGDVVLFLPKERIVCSGDLMEGVIPYLGDGFFDEWVTTLEALKQLDFAVCLPAHGRPFSDKERITHLQSYLTDVVAQVASVRARGIPAEEVIAHLDLSAHEKHWLPRLRPVDLRAVRRIYQWLEEVAAQPPAQARTPIDR